MVIGSTGASAQFRAKEVNMPRPALKVVIPFLVWMVHLESNVLAADRCADSGNDGFVCTRDILLLRERLDGRSVDMGVDQRIDGSEAEKQQIRDVLQEMEDYFLSEVLGMPEYEHVRPHW